LPAEGIARAFIALHGRGGEDGSVQGMLDVLGIAYTGSGILASALALDKWRAKLVWQAAGLSTPACRLLEGGIEPAQIVAELGLPLFVKPAREGSSLGAARVDTATELSTAYAAAARRDRLVLVERFISGTEVTVPFLVDKALPVVRIEAPDGLYDYQNKYFSDATRYHCPSGLRTNWKRPLQSVTLQAARLLGCRGWGRADLIVDDEGEAWLLEINTAPRYDRAFAGTDVGRRGRHRFS
jgi:D-alanine-D-alanine ligase